MANDRIPRPDAEFHAWQNNFVTYVNGHNDVRTTTIYAHVFNRGDKGVMSPVDGL